MKNLIKYGFIACVICFFTACNMDHSPLIVERVVSNGQDFTGSCNVLVGDDDWDHSDSKWIGDCPCDKYSVGDTLQIIVKAGNCR